MAILPRIVRRAGVFSVLEQGTLTPGTESPCTVLSETRER
jgi:hypothetical protein